MKVMYSIQVLWLTIMEDTQIGKIILVNKMLKKVVNSNKMKNLKLEEFQLLTTKILTMI